MLIGHYGVAFGFKAVERRISLGTLFIAANLPDIVWCILLIMGIEKTEIIPGYTKWVPLKGVFAPFSHGVAGVMLLAVGFALAAWIIGRFRKNEFPDNRTAAILGLVVFSHILLDILVHVKDVALIGANGTMLGLGLWNYPVISNILEIGIFLAGIIIYIKPNISDIRRTLPVLLFGLLLIIYHLANGLVPPPSGMSTTMLGISVLLGILIFSVIAEFIDRKFSRK